MKVKIVSQNDNETIVSHETLRVRAREKTMIKSIFRVFSIKVSKNISRYTWRKREIALLSNHFPARVRAPGGFLIHSYESGSNPGNKFSLTGWYNINTNLIACQGKSVMYMPLFVSILSIIGIALIFYYAVFILPYMVILSVSGGLMAWALICGNFTFGVMLFLSGLLFLGGGLAYVKDLIDSATSSHVGYFNYNRNR